MNKVFENIKKFANNHPVITSIITTGIISGITGAVCYGLGRNDISNVKVALDYIPHPSTGAPVPVFGNMVDLSERTDVCKDINVRHFYDIDYNVSVVIGTKGNIDKYASWWMENIQPYEDKAWDEEYENGLRKESSWKPLSDMINSMTGEETEA